VPYSAAKGGVNALTRSIAMEYSGSGIRINAVAPVATDEILTMQPLPCFSIHGSAARQPHRVGNSERYQPEQIEKEIRRSLFPTLWGCRAALPWMLKQGKAAVLHGNRPGQRIHTSLRRRIRHPVDPCCRHRRDMGKGCIVNISSVATAGVNRVPYSAAKGGVNALTRSIAI
jgi:NAD(P)-dependent dehydrogenase (short-subunit alcohol dehydrogenase family)